MPLVGEMDSFSNLQCNKTQKKNTKKMFVWCAEFNFQGRIDWLVGASLLYLYRQIVGFYFVCSSYAAMFGFKGVNELFV